MHPRSVILALGLALLPACGGSGSGPGSGGGPVPLAFSLAASLPLGPVFQTSACAWGDFDNDGDLDIAVAGGGTPFSIGFTRIYRNDGGTFTDILAGLPDVHECALAWGDFDNDGDLDLAIAGTETGGPPLTRIYRNTGGTFVDVGAGLLGVAGAALAWGDFDNDGDLDLAVAGLDAGVNESTRIYRNDGGPFVDIGAGIIAVRYASLAWGDFDKDGDLDLVVSGYQYLSGDFCRIYRNDGGTFNDIAAGLPGVSRGTVAWGDYDADGDLDLLLGGSNQSLGRICRLYRNDGGAFTDAQVGLPGVTQCRLAWVDADNDGDLDAAIAGSGVTSYVCNIYRNDHGTFVDIEAGLPATDPVSLAWGDFDNDGDMDLALAGGNVPTSLLRIYRSVGAPPNSPPAGPAGPAAFTGAGSALLVWSPASDAETPPAVLTYNLRIGKTSTGSGDYPSMADATGFRRIVAPGPIASNPGLVSAWVHLPSGGYFFSVQAVDSGLRGGAWSAAVPFSVP